jgi:UDP-N-acetylmuramate: L-alanyl-gamma-D-glutamyl-meso-diaminopimelate ligase
LVRDLNAHGKSAQAFESLEAIVARVVERARPGDTVALLSNGSFGGIHRQVLDALAKREHS